MEDKLKRYEKVEFLGEGQVIKKPSCAIFNETGLYYAVFNEFPCMKYIVVSNVNVAGEYSLIFLFLICSLLLFTKQGIQ